jgi:hypothetical protein
MEFKRDTFTKTRGDYSRLLSLSCRVCGKKVLEYQKDGPGNLRRIYLDRIFSPKKLTNLQDKLINKVPLLICHHCKEDLGTPYVYKKENRKAFKLYQDALVKKVIKLRTC